MLTKCNLTVVVGSYTCYTVLQWPFVGDTGEGLQTVEVSQNGALHVARVLLRRWSQNVHSGLPEQSTLNQYNCIQKIVLKWPFHSPRTESR